MDIENVAIDASYLSSLIDEGDKQQLRMVLNEQYPADLSEWLQEMDMQRRLSCFRLLDLDNASAVLAELDGESQKNLLRELGDIGVVPIIAKMEPDDAADLLAELPREKVTAILTKMTDDEAAGDLYELMSFKDDSAGGIMSTDVVSVNAKATAADALKEFRETVTYSEDEVYDLFVVDDDQTLVGWVSVRDLLNAPSDATVESVMDTSVIKVTTDTDQEEAVEKMIRYDLLALPVVDAIGKLRGIITTDDAFDVMQEEAQEDIYQTSGIDTKSGEAAEGLRSSVRQAFRARVPWLLVTLGIESVSAGVITHFQHVVQQAVIALAFMPLLNSATGSVAMQSTCIVLVEGRKTWHWRQLLRKLFHELRVGFLLGLACGLLTFLVTFIFNQANLKLGMVVAGSLFITMSFGVLVGTLIPILFQRLGIEAAQASGPLITSILDVATVTIYLSIVYACLSLIL
jgi:magnesium transporter